MQVERQISVDVNLSKRDTENIKRIMDLRGKVLVKKEARLLVTVLVEIEKKGLRAND